MEKTLSGLSLTDTARMDVSRSGLSTSAIKTFGWSNRSTACVHSGYWMEYSPSRYVTDIASADGMRNALQCTVPPPSIQMLL